ncbi:MAG TPA: hypothetical protein VGC80_01990, partial [Acetobacteraceae bacterium]
MAVQVLPNAPPRAAVLSILTTGPTEGVLTPVAHGKALGRDGAPAWFVVCATPPGPPLISPSGEIAPWSETEL